mmetsp:Transcript_43137/g.137762  ORF Transcript_43137/g.137762 Transcript_43137/m.137762 type:complete len:171 (-) Transcript_43137:43-555(-)|eukprot:CAMPEP_0182914004 /NCGR_PEP_ID=MMETSP0034_2-20130328/38329_1 /TAXON_ID=156128 /ORGANISM="Nephroselmis pyriformis, Strain CCMP717" /LENGTH=170 /DNA_ID=CAMNT_0025050733 /DNA_START=58 /DNA_END=570 /DNA_ORIENTATION=+
MFPGAVQDPNKPCELHPTAVGGAGIPTVTREALAQHGSEAEEIWLSILGQVFDVTAGKDRFYGPGKGYAFFAGRDGSKAYITGLFDEALGDLTDDISGLDGQLVDGINGWREFFHQRYKFVGNLAGGYFYEEDGAAKPTVEQVLKAMEAKDKQRKARAAEDAAAKEADNP